MTLRLSVLCAQRNNCAHESVLVAARRDNYAHQPVLIAARRDNCAHEPVLIVALRDNCAHSDSSLSTKKLLLATLSRSCNALTYLQAISYKLRIIEIYFMTYIQNKEKVNTDISLHIFVRHFSRENSRAKSILFNNFFRIVLHQWTHVFVGQIAVKIWNSLSLFMGYSMIAGECLVWIKSSFLLCYSFEWGDVIGLHQHFVFATAQSCQKPFCRNTASVSNIRCNERQENIFWGYLNINKN